MACYDGGDLRKGAFVRKKMKCIFFSFFEKETKTDFFAILFIIRFLFFWKIENGKLQTIFIL